MMPARCRKCGRLPAAFVGPLGRFEFIFECCAFCCCGLSDASMAEARLNATAHWNRHQRDRPPPMIPFRNLEDPKRWGM